MASKYRMVHLNRRHVLASGSALVLIGTEAEATTLAASPEQAQAASTTHLGRKRFDDGWRFAFGHLNDIEKDFGWGKDLNTFAKQCPNTTPVAASEYDDSKWRALNLPHDWAVELPFAHKANDTNVWWDAAANHGYKPLGRDYPETSIGWYRKTFKLDAADKGKRISLEFDGVFRNATVIINGYIVKQHDGGYTPFRVELNDFLNTDDKPNTILVRVDASLGEGWFYEGAGVYRHVWLTKTNPVHIPQ